VEASSRLAHNRSGQAGHGREEEKTDNHHSKWLRSVNGNTRSGASDSYAR